jgi:hypothetical protein
MRTRDEPYYVVTGKLFDGKKAAEMGLVKESVSLAQLRQRTRELCVVLLEKDPVVVKQAKDAFKRIQGLPWDISEDYLLSKQEPLWRIAGHAREEGFKQFLDDRTYKPGRLLSENAGIPVGWPDAGLQEDPRYCDSSPQKRSQAEASEANPATLHNNALHIASGEIRLDWPALQAMQLLNAHLFSFRA